MSQNAEFFRARQFLLDHREDYEYAKANFRWESPEYFNWARDYFDSLAKGNEQSAVIVVQEDGLERKISFSEISNRSNQVANFLLRIGVGPGDRLLIMLSSQIPLWEVMLAAMKIGAVICPATTLLPAHEVLDRTRRAGIRFAIVEHSQVEKFSDPELNQLLRGKILVGGAEDGWISFEDSDRESTELRNEVPTRSSDPLILYFTSGTTAQPKMVLHSHESYPVGHLSTMYWIGLKPGDRHFNISSPGWAKHAWSSVFAPWNAGATVFSLLLPRFDPKKVLAALSRYEITTLCAPPTVWRMLILEDLASYCLPKLRELVSAGEPLNPEVIEQVEKAWGLQIRDGYGQTETSAQIGNSPGQKLKIGSMGRPLPGFRVGLLDEESREGIDGEIALSLEDSPIGLMRGYQESNGDLAPLSGQHWYRTSDTATRDEDGYYWYLGRSDDVFKSADYRISPFELESILLEHEAVVEAAVVPSPDPLRLSVPKAFIALRPEIEPTCELAGEILSFARSRLAPYQRIRRIEFAELPKTISGKIRRVQLRALERERRAGRASSVLDFHEEEFGDLISAPGHAIREVKEADKPKQA